MSFAQISCAHVFATQKQCFCLEWLSAPNYLFALRSKRKGRSERYQNKIPINLLICKIKYNFLSKINNFSGNFSNSTQHDLPTTIYTCILHIAYKQISTTNVTLQKRSKTSKLRHMEFVTMPPKNMPSWHDIGGQG